MSRPRLGRIEPRLVTPAEIEGLCLPAGDAAADAFERDIAMDEEDGDVAGLDEEFPP